MDTSGEPHRGVLTGEDMARLGGAHRGAAHLRLRPLHRLQGRPVVARSGDAAAARAAQALRSRRRRSGERGLRPSLVECSKLAYADREKFYGDPDFVEVPMATLLSDAYNDERRKLITDKASLELRRARSRASARWSSCAARTASAAPSAAGRRRADRRPPGRNARRHRAFRHRRSGRQHGVGDAVRRLAAVVAGHSGARLLSRHSRADVLARGGPSRLARARQAAAHDAVAHAWRCATASRTWPGARPAATSRINGRRSCSCATSMPA